MTKVDGEPYRVDPRIIEWIEVVQYEWGVARDEERGVTVLRFGRYFDNTEPYKIVEFFDSGSVDAIKVGERSGHQFPLASFPSRKWALRWLFGELIDLARRPLWRLGTLYTPRTIAPGTYTTAEGPGPGPFPLYIGGEYVATFRWFSDLFRPSYLMRGSYEEIVATMKSADGLPLMPQDGLGSHRG